MTIMGVKCGACGHEHAGADLAYICIGCPCPARPGREEDADYDGTPPYEDDGESPVCARTVTEAMRRSAGRS